MMRLTPAERLALSALRLAERNCPANGWTEDDLLPTGHWSETKSAMECHFLRRLTPREITCLSLSRAFGPMPALTDAQAVHLVDQLWPRGNQSGQWLDWTALAERLCGIEVA